VSRQYSDITAFVLTCVLMILFAVVYVLVVLPLAVIGWTAMRLTAGMRRRAQLPCCKLIPLEEEVNV